jgi:hypothetical protein
MENLFQKTLEEIDFYSKILKSIVEKSVELGVPEKGVNVHNAHQKVQSTLKLFMEYEKIAHEMGYSSVKVALKALRQMKEQPAYDITKLPPLFHKMPAIWLSGKPDSKGQKGFPPMRVRDAERQHRVIVPLLIEAWALIGGDEEVQLQVEKDYRNMSADQLERELYTYIYELEEPTLEEQLAERAAVKQAEFEDWKEQNARAREKREHRTNRSAK